MVTGESGVTITPGREASAGSAAVGTSAATPSITGRSWVTRPPSWVTAAPAEMPAPRAWTITGDVAAFAAADRRGRAWSPADVSGVGGVAIAAAPTTSGTVNSAATLHDR